MDIAVETKALRRVYRSRTQEVVALDGSAVSRRRPVAPAGHHRCHAHVAHLVFTWADRLARRKGLIDMES